MSYRESRLFVDALRTLGFREQPVSESSFTYPNFELLVDILEFLCVTLDPRVQLPEEIATENDRVLFIRKALACILSRTGVKLAPKLLYQADAFAVKELLKVLYFLTAPSSPAQGLQPAHPTVSSHAAVKETHQRLLESSGNLFRLLLNKPQFTLPDSISDLHALATNDEHALEIADQALGESITQEARLASLVQKRRAELERTTRRLATIKSVRPAFLDEYRKLEEELAELYAAYVEKFKILDFNEHQLDLLNLAEQRKLEAREEAVALANKKLREEEWRTMRGESSATTKPGTATLPPSGRNSAQELPAPESIKEDEDEVSIDEDDGESGGEDDEDEDDLYRVEDEDNSDF